MHDSTFKDTNSYTICTHTYVYYFLLRLCSYHYCVTEYSSVYSNGDQTRNILEERITQNVKYVQKCFHTFCPSFVDIVCLCIYTLINNGRYVSIESTQYHVNVFISSETVSVETSVKIC